MKVLQNPKGLRLPRSWQLAKMRINRRLCFLELGRYKAVFKAIQKTALEVTRKIHYPYFELLLTLQVVWIRREELGPTRNTEKYNTETDQYGMFNQASESSIRLAYHMVSLGGEWDDEDSIGVDPDFFL